MNDPLRGRREAGGGRRFLIPVVALVAACGGGDGRDGASSVRGGDRTAQSPAAAPLPPPATDCPADGRWHPCSVVKRLEMAGYVPVVEDSAAQEKPLAATGTTYRLGKGTLTVFLYPDSAARVADAAQLDTTRFIGPYQPVTMRNEPARIASANLLAILRTRSDRQRERVGDALTAGPPQKR